MKDLLLNWKTDSSIFLNEKSQSITYKQLAGLIEKQIAVIEARFPKSTPFALEAENTIDTFVKFLSLLCSKYPVILCPSYQFNSLEYRRLLEEETKTSFHFCSLQQKFIDVNLLKENKMHPEIKKALGAGHALFLVRTSGSSGKKFKYILHNAGNFISKYRKIGPHFERTIAFSPAESIAGIETLLETVTHSRTLVAAGDRLSPVLVKDLIQQHSVDYFQTTPTFLNLMVLSRQIQSEPLRSLKKIAYGSEPSVENVLEAIQKELSVEMKHTYGMSEIGIQVTKTSQNNPTYFLLDQHFNPGRIVDGHLEVQSMTKMLCYLNYESNQDEWFATGDMVSERQGFIKVLGRQDDLINMAGRKFYPSELEEIIVKMPHVQDVIVSKEPNELIGSAITVKIVIDSQLSEKDFRMQFKAYSEAFIPFFMHPHRVTVTNQMPDHPRFKKIR